MKRASGMVRVWRAVGLSLALTLGGTYAGAQGIADVAKGFANPPDDARALMRWWWFGPAVTKPELEREILAMKAGGFGGFEIQPVYPLALDDSAKGFKNLSYMSPEFLEMVKFAADTAKKNGMRVDLTLASGWPYGGAHVPVNEAAAQLRMVAADIPAGSASVAMPALGNGESLVAAFIGDGTALTNNVASLKLFTVYAKGGRTSIAPSTSARFVSFYVASRTGQQVKRAAVGSEGFVLDHLSTKAVQDHLRIVADPLIKVFGDTPPYSVFSDSLEVYGTDWTDDMLAEFKRRRGYDLLPHLPELYSDVGENARSVRRDWGLTQTELAEERYLTPINDWAKAHHTRFRSQTYGEPAVAMSSNRLVDLPEGEGPQWRSFSFTRWATSASHLYGRAVTSAETWTWLHSPAFRATPLDMKAEADRMFLEGVNQFVGHGWPYTPPSVSEPGYAFYAAAVFNDHTPWWPVMPDVAKYFQRVSYLLRQGKPANDVAVFLPDDDVYAEFSPGKTSISGAMAKFVTSTVTEQVLDAGFNLDYIDSSAIDQVGIPYAALILPHVTRVSPATLEKIAAYQLAGGKVIVLGDLPSEAPGFADHAAVSAKVRELAKSLAATKNVTSVATDTTLGAALKAAVPPDVTVSSQVEDVGFVHRKLNDADVYFIANTSNHPVHATATFRTPRAHAAWLNPFDGTATAASSKPEMDLAPYESRVIVFTDAPLTKAMPTHSATNVLADLSHDWRVTFAGKTDAVEMKDLKSWTDDDRTKYFSGVATYTKDVTITTTQKMNGTLWLDFGEGTVVTQTPKVPSGMRAMLESPVREGAEVWVNGVRVGGIWHPPYRVEVTAAMHEGANHLEIKVGNLAINTLAGRAPTNYRLLNSKYGERFVPQDMKDLTPIPAGILGPVKLIEEHVQ
jgi:hypothetical protein